MKWRKTIVQLTALAVAALISAVLMAPSSAFAGGATQISGVSFFDEANVCNASSQDADFALIMTGDLEGCHYVFIDSVECSPSGTYREEGRERFVGTYNGAAGTFLTTYKFESKYEGCADDGSFIGAEIFGRCQHPLVVGRNTGVFEGATGRLDFKDDIAAGNFPYRGHLRFS
ncbi:MAG TPA: hypothetical protein VFX76_23155 [Roseiflexaceae bacterium]|nr:hypothetical protein [Roseiflexaceae bacterium]